MRKSFHDSGKVSLVKIALKEVRRAWIIESRRLAIILLSIRYKPGAQ